VEGEGHEEALDRTKEIGGGWAAHAVEEVVEVRTRRRRRGALHRNFARRRRRLPCGVRARARRRIRLSLTSRFTVTLTR